MRGRSLLTRIGVMAGSAGMAMMSALLPVQAATTATAIVGSGSDTTWFMMTKMDELYDLSPGCQVIGSPQVYDFSCYSPDPAGTVTSENYAHDQVREAYYLGSSTGIYQLSHQTTTGVAHVDFARSSRAPKTSDLHGEHFVAYALDAIMWESFDQGTTYGIHGQNRSLETGQALTDIGGCGSYTGQYCLSSKQLYDIYVTCTITNWSQLGGQNVPITVYTPQSGSGTRGQFEAFLATAGGVTSANSESCIPAANNSTGANCSPTWTSSCQIESQENNNSWIPAAARTGAITPFSVGVWVQQAWFSGGATAGALDGVDLTVNSIQNGPSGGPGTYPWWRYLFNVYCVAGITGSCATSSSAPTVNYVGEEGWICKPQAANPAVPNFTGHVNDPYSNVDPTKQQNYWSEIQYTIQGGINKATNLIGPSDLGTGAGSTFLPLTSGVIGGGDSNSDTCRLFVT